MSRTVTAILSVSIIGAMVRTRLTHHSVVDRALAVADRDGFDALSISSVASELGVGPSALYNHIRGLEDLQYLVAVAATRNLVTTVRSAAVGTAGPNALSAMGVNYRQFSLDHPGQFASTLLPPRSGDDELAEQDRELLGLFITVFRMMGIADDDAYLAARSTRSALHGFLALEHNSGTSGSHGVEYRHLIDTLQRGLLLEARAESTPSTSTAPIRPGDSDGSVTSHLGDHRHVEQP